MTDNNNKFVPQAQTYEVRYLEQQEIQQQKPKLSLAARSKIVNRNNSRLSSKSTDLAPSYGPCSGCNRYTDIGEDRKFCLSIELKGGGFLGTGIFRGSFSKVVYNTNDAVEVAEDIVNSRGQWGNVGCSYNDRKALRDKINECISQHRLGKEYYYTTVSNI